MAHPEGSQSPDKRGANAKASEPVGPFDPPLPLDAEKGEATMPMAVANDEESGKSHLPTTQSKDAYSPEVAEKWRAHPSSAYSENPEDQERRMGSPEAEKPETAAMQDPPGFTKTNEKGWKEMIWDEKAHE